MKIKFKKTPLIILKILLTISLICYLVIFVGEIIPPFSEPLFGIIMVYVLFFIFLIGYYFLWKNPRLSGIIVVFWYVLLLFLGFFVWTNAGMVIILGFPVGVLGVLLIVYSYRNRTNNKNN